MQSIVNAVGILSDLPNGQIGAAFAAENPPEDVNQGVTVVPLDRPGLVEGRDGEQTKSKDLHWDRIKNYAQQVRADAGS
jgi:hypothetical protein